MITPNEIKDQCLKWWKDLLVSVIEGNSFFPKEIVRIGKINSKNLLTKLTEHKSNIQLLRDNSKEYKGYGYSVVLEERQFEKIGKQQVPEKVAIATIEDYLKLLSKEREYVKFCSNLSIIRSELPVLTGWTKTNPLKLIEHNTWTETIKVCSYFLENPEPNLYIRQLPIEVHTKYIQENRAIIESLLEFLIPDFVKYDHSKFEQRFNLKYSEPLVRIRFLQSDLAPKKGLTDISMPLSEFSSYDCPCQNVLVTENLMNFLTLPSLSNTIAIWSGGGFSVSYLKDVNWLVNKQFYYWGDIDAQGFQILNQFRTYFPNTVSVMMDWETLNMFKSGEGKQCHHQNLEKLTSEESKLYQHLREQNLRLEQEKILQSYAEERIFSALSMEATLNNT